MGVTERGVRVDFSSSVTIVSKWKRTSDTSVSTIAPQESCFLCLC